MDRKQARSRFNTTGARLENAPIAEDPGNIQVNFNTYSSLWCNQRGYLQSLPAAMFY
jgi:hypothetical protein